MPEIDYETKRRQRRISNSQPLRLPAPVRQVFSSASPVTRTQRVTIVTLAITLLLGLIVAGVYILSTGKAWR